MVVGRKRDASTCGGVATRTSLVLHWLPLGRRRRLPCSVALTFCARLYIFPMLFAYFLELSLLPPPSPASPPHRCSRRRTKSIKKPQGFSLKFETRCFSCSVAFASVSPMERGADLLRSFTDFSNAFCLFVMDTGGTRAGCRHYVVQI